MTDGLVSGSRLGWRLRLFVARVMAYVFDVVLTAGMIAVSQAVIWRAGWNPLDRMSTHGQLHAWVSVTVTIPVFLYFVATTWLHGATYGQSLLKLRA